MIADEPTTALDVTVQKTILQLLLKLKAERNMAMIFISHDLGVVNENADEVAVTYKDEIVEQDTAKSIFERPQHPYTKGLLACRPSPSLRLKKLPIVADFLTGKTDDASAHLIAANQLTDDEIALRREQLYSQKPLLEVKNLCTWYPIHKGLFSRATDHVKAVYQLNFKVFSGETLGLVGESGCGKTTLGRTILRLIEPTSGHIVFNRQDITHIEKTALRKLRKDIQIIF